MLFKKTFTVLVLSAACASISYANTITSRYNCVAHDPASGKAFHSVLTVKHLNHKGKVYNLTWKFSDGDTSKGTGLLLKVHHNTILTAAYHAERHASDVGPKDHTGLITYEVKHHKLVHGEWLYLQSNVIGTETCAPMKAHHKMP